MNAIIYRTHINFHSACYRCRPVCGRLSAALLDSGELEFQHLVTTNTSEKRISVLTLLNPCDRCSPTAKPGWGSAVNLCERLSTNPSCSEYGRISACSFPTQPQGAAVKTRQELAPQGMSINNWAATGEKEYEVVAHVAATAQWQTFITWNSLYPKSQSNLHERGTTKPAALPNAHATLLDRKWHHDSKENGSWDLHTQRTAMRRRGVLLVSGAATFVLSNSRYCIRSKKSVRCLLSSREQDNNLLSNVFKRKLLRYLLYALVCKPRFFTSYISKFQRSSEGKI